MKKSSLYICYQSIFEPLTETQVVAYLRGLAEAGYRVVLLTFEPRKLTKQEAHERRNSLAEQGIAWHWRRYHKRPSLVATMWDTLVGIWTGRRLIRRYQVRLVHARVHVPGLMGLVLKWLTGVKLLFDIRGLMAEEYADAGIWREGSMLFRQVKRLERRLVEQADAIVVLTEKVRVLFETWYGDELVGKALEVIPCCVDLAERRYMGSHGDSERSRPTHTMIYAGKLGGCYPTKEIASFIATAAQSFPVLGLRFLTPTCPPELLATIKETDSIARFHSDHVSPDKVPVELARATIGLCFYRQTPSLVGRSPTKIAEYLAAGLPVVATAGVGDTDQILRNDDGGGPVGVLIERLEPDCYRAATHELLSLLDDPGLSDRCRAAAARHFDVRQVAWPRYRRLYARLLGEPTADNAETESREVALSTVDA